MTTSESKGATLNDTTCRSEVVEIASRTDSLSASDSWEVRARVLAALGRDEEMHQAAARARELYVEKGALAFIRRIDGFLSAARR